MPGNTLANDVEMNEQAIAFLLGTLIGLSFFDWERGTVYSYLEEEGG